MRPTEVLLITIIISTAITKIHITSRLEKHLCYIHRKKYTSLNKALLDIFKAAFEDLIHLFHL